MICIRDERLRYQTYSPSWVFGLEVQTMKTVMPSMLRCDDETWVVNRPKSSPRWDASISTHPYGACTRWKRDAWAMSVWVWVLRASHWPSVKATRVHEALRNHNVCLRTRLSRDLGKVVGGWEDEGWLVVGRCVLADWRGSVWRVCQPLQFYLSRNVQFFNVSRKDASAWR